MSPLQTIFDVANCRGMAVAGREDDAFVTFTAVADLAAVVARAVDCGDGVGWPVVGGVRGNRLSARRIAEIAERVRGAFVTLLFCFLPPLSLSLRVFQSIYRTSVHSCMHCSSILRL